MQSTIYDILKDGSELADTVFSNFKAAFDRCRKYVSRRVFVRGTGETTSKRKDLASEAKKGEADGWGGPLLSFVTSSLAVP